MGKTYIIDYDVYLEGGASFLGKKTKVSNCMSELQAKVKLENWLKGKHQTFKQLVVSKCVEDLGLDGLFGKDFNDKNLFDLNNSKSSFGDLFGNLFGGKK